MEIFRLFGSIFIENEKANKSLKDTDQQAEKVGKTLQSTIKTASKWGQEMGKQLTTVGTNISKKAGVPLAALTALMGGLAKTTADYTATVKDNAVVVGLTTQAYQELNYAMQQSGLSQDDFVRMMGRVNQRVGMARQGNQKYRKSLEEMGLSLEAVDAGLVTTDEAFMAMIEHLHGLDDGQEQAALAGEFFGTMLSRRMMPLIKDGAQSVEELRQRAHDLGLVMDDLAVAKGDLLSDTLDDLSFTAKGLGRIFGSEMHAPMINIANAITDVISRFSAWLTENPKVVRQIIIWGGAIAGVLGVLVTLGTTLVITGKIIGVLGAVFNILTSKPLLIIAAIGALYLAWESDWLGIRTAVEDAWAIISPVIDAIIEWGHQTISTVWNWTTKTVSAFLSWVQETAWPWIDGTVSTAWDWAKGKTDAFVTWIKDTAWPIITEGASTVWSWGKGTVDGFVTWVKSTAWPVITEGASTVWNWAEGTVDKFVTWLKDTAWPVISGGASTAWNWSKGKVGEFITWIKDTAWPVISGGASTAWSWTLGAVDSFITWIKDTAWPWIDGTVSTVWEWSIAGWDKIKDAIDAIREFLGWDSEESEESEGLGGGGGGARAPQEYDSVWDIPVTELGQYVSSRSIVEELEIEEAREGLREIDGLLDAIYRAEGGAKARAPYGMTGFADAGNKFSNERNQALFEELAKGLEEGSEEYYRAAVSVSVQHYWNTFQQKFPEVAGKTFEQLEPEMQQLFVLHMGRGFAPPSASEKNINWVPNVLSILGHEDAAAEFRAGSQELLNAWIEGVYDMASDAEAAAAYIAGIFADYLVGESPPPLGPLSVIDEGGANVMGAWIEGTEDGLKDGVPKLTGALENIKNLFGTIWDKVPEEIKGPIEQAMTWITDLIGQAEEALFKLDDFQAELDALMGGGASPEEQAQGFMNRLAKALDEKLEALDDPLTRFVDMVSSAALHLGEVVKAVSSGDWVGAILSIIMETESFAKAMELIGKVMKPIVALFDIILRPIVEGLLKLWNGIIDALASISIFGWKPFEGLARHKVSWDDDAGGGSGGRDGGTGGRQISEITGPTRDLLVDLLSPLANFGQIVAPIQDIRNILYERLPNFDAFGMDFAGAGVGAMGPAVIIENLNVSALTTGVDDISRATIDQIEKALADRISFGIRGRGGR